MPLQLTVSKILIHRGLQNYQNFIELTSNMIYIVALGGGFKCPHKIHLNAQCSVGEGEALGCPKLRNSSDGHLAKKNLKFLSISSYTSNH